MAVPEEKQIAAFRRIRQMTPLPLITAGRMADMDKLRLFEEEGIADMVAFGRALLADPMKERLSTAEAQQQLAMQAQFFANATYEVSETTMEADAARVTVIFKLKRGEQTMDMPLLFTLSKVDGRWLCTDFRPKR